MTDRTYEDSFGRAARRLERIGRTIRWIAKSSMGVPRNVLVELRWRLGDEVMALPVYGAIRARWPDCRISVLCRFPELLEGNPHVAAVNEIPSVADRYVLLRSDARTEPRIAHYARLAGVPVPGDPPRLCYEDWGTPLLEGIPRPFVCVAGGASWPAKRWPSERWRALCAALGRIGWPVVELGSGDDAIGAPISLLDKTTVREAACVLHAASLAICCDSGLMHLGLAAGTRALALFGPTSPAILVPNDPRLHAIRSAEPCQACWNEGRTMTTPGICPLGREDCLESISVERVFERARALLAAES